MRISKGRPQFGFRDTYCADSALSPIIAAWLRKFVATITEPGKDHRKGLPGGLPQEYLNKPDTESDEEWELCFNMFLNEIAEMIWAFDPDPEPYYHGGYHEGPHHGEVSYHGGERCTRWDMEPNNKEAWDQSLRDREAWYKRRQQGFDLFAKRFNNLWW